MTSANYTALLEKMLVSCCQDVDPMKALLEWLVKELMEIGVRTLKTTVEKGKHAPQRTAHRNGYRVRRWDTRVGTCYLLIPKVRNGGHQPFFLVHKQRSEAALISVIQEAYINGISTRKMQKVLSAFGIENISAGQISNLTRSLQDEVDQFRNRSLLSHYPVVWIDALYEKIRVNGKVVSMAVMIAMVIDLNGTKHLLAIEPMENESQDTWLSFFQKLKSRGLQTVDLLISDAHSGIQSALKGQFIGSAWQRCKVHFIRNVLSKTPHKSKAKIGTELAAVFDYDKFDDALEAANLIIRRYESDFPNAMDCLSDGIVDSLQFLNFPELPPQRVSSTNYLERLNREIRRRSRVVTTFPSVDSFRRRIGAYLIEYHEDWSNDIAYINHNKLCHFAANLSERRSA